MNTIELVWEAIKLLPLMLWSILTTALEALGIAGWFIIKWGTFVFWPSILWFGYNSWLKRKCRRHALDGVYYEYRDHSVSYWHNRPKGPVDYVFILVGALWILVLITTVMMNLPPQLDDGFRVKVYEDQSHMCFAEGGGQYDQRNSHWVFCYNRMGDMTDWVCKYLVLSTDDFGGNSAAMYYNCARSG